MMRLPGYSYRGDDPDGYMSAGEVVDLISAYATYASPPVLTHTAVTAVVPDGGSGDGCRVATDHGDWLCRAVVPVERVRVFGQFGG